MINLLIGAPGGGKSYEATVFHILPALQAGRMVVTNLPCNVEEFSRLDPRYRAQLCVLDDSDKANRPFRTVDDFTRWNWKDEQTGVGPLLVIDEAHEVMRNGSTSTAVKDFAARHRHTGQDWLLITQSIGKLEREIRDLTQLTYFVRKKTAWGQADRYIRKVYDGLKGKGDGNCVQTGERVYEKKFFRLYKSHTASNKAVQEAFASDVNPRYKKFQRAGFAVIGIGLALMVFNYFHHKNKPEPQPVAQAHPVVSTAQPVSPQPGPAAAPRTAGGRAAAATAKGQDVQPFDGMRFHARAAIWNRDRHAFLFAVSQNGAVQFDVTDRALKGLGYRVERLDNCLFRITDSNDRAQLVFCDAPQGRGMSPVATPAAQAITPHELGKTVQAVPGRVQQSASMGSNPQPDNPGAWPSPAQKGMGGRPSSNGRS